MENRQIREQIWAKRIPQWMIADRIGISEYTFCKWLRHDLSEEKEARVKTAIEQIEKERGAK